MATSCMDHRGQYQLCRIRSVVERSSGGYELTFDDGWSFVCPDVGILPQPGDLARLYGRGVGYHLSGLSINGEIVFYNHPMLEGGQ